MEHLQRYRTSPAGCDQVLLSNSVCWQSVLEAEWRPNDFTLQNSPPYTCLAVTGYPLNAVGLCKMQESSKKRRLLEVSIVISASVPGSQRRYHIKHTDVHPPQDASITFYYPESLFCALLWFSYTLLTEFWWLHRYICQLPIPLYYDSALTVSLESALVSELYLNHRAQNMSFFLDKVIVVGIL